MITFPANFQAELDKGQNKLATIVYMQDSVNEAEKTSEVDWGNNSSESQVDYTSTPPPSGDVILEAVTPPDEENLTGNTWSILKQTVWLDGAPVSAQENQHWQSFKQISGFKELNLVKGYFKRSTDGSLHKAKCSIWDSTKTTQYGSTVEVSVSSTTGAWETFDFSAQGIDILDSTEYWLKFEATFTPATPGVGSANTVVEQKYQNTNVYADGQFDKTGSFPGTDLGDLMFEISFIGDYFQTTGFITTDNLDLGATPTVEGEWKFDDTKEDGSLLTYTAEASSTGAFAGEETAIGAIIDGDKIIVLERYYRVKATFTPSSNRSVSSVLHSIIASFPVYNIFTDTLSIAPANDFEMGVMSLTNLTSTIDDFRESKIGQINITLNFNASISKYLFSKFPKNKLIKVLIGFDIEGFAISDFVEYFRGQIVDYVINLNDTVTVMTQSFQVEWTKNVPETWESAADDKTWTTTHPTDVMLDIIRNYMDVRDSKIVASSFDTVKALIPTWEVTRSITEDPESAKDLIEELRIMTSSYFIPQSDGSIFLKRFDASEASIASFSDANTKSIIYKGNLKEIRNKTIIYYAHGEDGAGAYTNPEDGDNAVDFEELEIALDVTSVDNWLETRRKNIKDRWTRSTEASQITSFSTTLLTRYKNPPSIIDIVSDQKFLFVETGDIVDVTTLRAPSVDGISGISAQKFQVVSQFFDFKMGSMKFTLLEV